MKQLIKDIITPEEASYLIDLTSGEKISVKHPTIKKDLIDKIKGVINDLVQVSWKQPSYIKLECNRQKPHNWHLDTGSRNHMTWCSYGCSILLNDREGAGYLEYRDGTVIEAEDHYCSLAIHSSDEEHRTIHEPNKRTTLLVFLAS